MRTLPTNIQTGRMGGKIIYLVIINGGTYRFATRDITISGNVYDGGRIVQGGIGKITQSIDLDKGGNAAAVDVFNLVLVNIDGFHTQWEAASLQSTSVVVKLVFDDGTTLTDANCLTLGTFVIEEWNWNELTLNIRCVDYGETRHKDLPGNFIEKADFPNCPQETIGNPIPIVYGDFGSLAGVVNQIDNNVAKSIFVGWYLFADHYDSSGWARYWDSYSTQFIEFADAGNVPAGSGAQNSSDGTTENFLVDNYSYIELTGTAFNLYVKLMPDIEYNGVAITNDCTSDWENAVDNSLTTYATLPQPVPGGIETKRLAVSFSYKRLEKNALTASGTVEINAKVKITMDGALSANETANLKVYVDEIQKGTVAITGTGDFNIDLSGVIDDIDTGFDTIPCDVVMVVEHNDTGGAPTATIKVKNLYLQQRKISPLGTIQERFDEYYTKQNKVINHFLWWNIKSSYLKHSVLADRNFVINNTASIFANIRGRLFGTWIDAVGRSNSYNSGDLIEYAAFPIEAILRNQLGLGNAEIDTASFDAVGQSLLAPTRVSWKFAKQIFDIENSLDIIADFCRECGLIYLHTYEGKEKVLTLNYDSTPAKTITAQMILLNSDKTASLKWGFTDLRDVYNDFSLSYQKNYATGGYFGNLFVNKDDASAEVTSTYPTLQTLCSDSYTAYGLIRKLNFKCEWIRDETTALLLLNHLVRWLSRRKRIASFQSSLILCDLEIGDQVKITDDWTPADNPTMMVTRLDLDPSTDMINVELIEIKSDIP